MLSLSISNPNKSKTNNKEINLKENKSKQKSLGYSNFWNNDRGNFYNLNENNFTDFSSKME